MHCVIGGGGKCEENAALAEFLVDGDDARCGDNEFRGRTAKQAADLAEAARAGDEDPLTGLTAGSRAGRDDPAGSFITEDGERATE